MTKAMDYFDLCRGGSTLAQALAELRSRVLLLSFSSDWLFPTHHSREIVDALRVSDAEVSFAEIESPYGHDAFLLEPEQQRSYVEPFLAGVLESERSAIRSARGAEPDAREVVRS